MKINPSIKFWAEDDRPREKLKLKGRSALSDAEILAILLGSGSRSQTAVELAQEIMSSFDHDLAKLSKLTIADLQKFKGVGEAKAITIMAALELGRRRRSIAKKQAVKITCAKDAYDLLQPNLEDLQHEEFFVILMNKACLVQKVHRLSQGGVDSTIVDGKMIFKAALDNLSSAIILAHNHPSGNLKPSELDRRLTKNLQKFGELVGIQILDHLIISDNGYFSFSEKNIL